MKAYTDTEQSKKLTEILPLESADMYYSATMYGKRQEIIWTSWEVNLDFDDRIRDRHEYTVPCWSLAALLSVLSCPELTQTSDGRWMIRTWYKYHPYSVGGVGDPVDACVEMIIKLHELNLLVL